MMLKDLISGVNVISTAGDCDVEIKGVAYSSSEISNGFCFVALRGAHTDGNDFVPDALARGAAAVVTEKADCNCGGAVKVFVRDARGGHGQNIMCVLWQSEFRNETRGSNRHKW